VCSFRKYPHSPHGRTLKIPRGGWGVSKSKKYYRKVWSETGTSRGVGENLENWGGGDILWNHTMAGLHAKYITAALQAATILAP